jgi:hypothetical protein
MDRNKLSSSKRLVAVHWICGRAGATGNDVSSGFSPFDLLKTQK